MQEILPTVMVRAVCYSLHVTLSQYWNNYEARKLRLFVHISHDQNKYPNNVMLNVT